MKISVIIPVYNCEKYLERCLDSIIEQSYKDFEIICVDDGSTDNSLEILKKYAQKHINISIYTQENKGPSAARNYGMEKAKGEYITFVDADDWLDLDCFEKLISKDLNVDLIYFNYIEHIENVLVPHVYYDFQKPYINKVSEFYNEAFYFPQTSWGKLIKSEFLKKYNIIFDQKILCTEDKVFWYEVLSHKPSIYTVDNMFYHYYRRKGSETYNFTLERIFHNTIDNLKAKDFYKNSSELEQATMLDWLIPEINIYWERAKGEIYNKEINEYINYFDNFDDKIIRELKIYPTYKKVMKLCQNKLIKSLYLIFLKIPKPVLKKIKKVLMR